MKLYLLPVLALLTWIGGVSNVTPAAATPITPAPAQTIYDGSLENGWQYWGWANTNLSNPTPALSASSIAAQEGAWQSVYLHHAPLQTVPLMTLSFWVNGGPTGGQSLTIRATRSGVPQASFSLSNLRPNVWRQVTIALPRLGVGAVPDMDGLWIENGSSKTLPQFYVDRIALTAPGTPLPPPPPPAPSAPAGLSATPLWNTNSSVSGGPGTPQIVLNWNTVSGATAYTVYRGGVKQVSQAAPGWTDISVTSGQAYSYTVTATGPGGEGSPSAAVTATAPSPPPTPAPPAPTGLSATPLWTPSCPVCGGMAMAHIVLAWNAVSGATAYTVYRGGVQVVSQAAPGWTDMSVTSGQTYSYTVTATGPGGESAPSAAVSAIAPSPPPAAAALPAPVNLSVTGVWTGASSDTLSWAPVPGAATYNVYQYGTQIGSGLTATTFAVPSAVWWNGMTYTVTAVNSTGAESLPSAPATAQGGLDPNQAPACSPAAPGVPWGLTATPEWNAGVPRIHLTWHVNNTNYTDTDFTYTLYRDGQPVAVGLWGLSGYDQNVSPGETHTYTVTGSNVVWTQSFESAPSAPVTATALSAAPSSAGVPVQITGVTADDDSALITFAAVPGAVDYRVYDTSNPGAVKYSGGSLSIQENGLNPSGATVVVEAVDKFGPFEAHSMASAMPAGAMPMSMTTVNGQGDPSDVPIVLAASAPTAITFTPRTLDGNQAFFDNFRSENPLVAQPIPAPIPGDNGGEYGCPGNYSVVANDKWEIRNYAGDLANTQTFFMGSHFMDVLYDGGTAHVTSVMHNNNASIVLMPKTTADISGGKVLHVTMEVDGHFDSRRWCDIVVAPAADTFMNPGKLDGGLWPTTSGNMFRWQIEGEFHLPEVYNNNAETLLVNVANGINSDNAAVQRDDLWVNGAGAVGIGSNGTTQDLDKRHQFDLYLSQTHFRIYEAGQLIKDADLPAGQSLPFSQCQVYFVHELYHTGNDRPEQVLGNGTGTAYWNSYWYDYCPWSDERHWDNMGQSVLDAFPALP